MLSNLMNKKLTNETISTINLFTGADIKANEEGEVTDVCLAIEEMKRKAAEKAAAETRAEDLTDNVESIMKNLHISLECACKALNHTLEDYEKAKALVESLQTA